MLWDLTPLHTRDQEKFLKKERNWNRTGFQ